MKNAIPSLHIIRDLEQAAVLLHGERHHLLKQLAQPASATGLAQQLKLPRQKINYHLRLLEKVGLVELYEERKARNCIERIMRATAESYVISPEILEALGNTPKERQDTFSASTLVAKSAQTIRELGILRAKADAAGKRLATLSLESNLNFASAKDRNAFAEEITNVLADLIAKYDQPAAKNARPFRLTLGIHPSLQRDPTDS